MTRREVVIAALAKYERRTLKALREGIKLGDQRGEDYPGERANLYKLLEALSTVQAEVLTDDDGEWE